MIMLLVYIALGIVSGILGGLLGISGGIIAVPSLAFLFKIEGLPKDDLMHIAIGTSMAAMTFNAISSMRAHHARGMINWTLVKKVLPGLFLGCILGSEIANLLPTNVLQVIFGLFTISLGIYFFIGKKEEEHLNSSIPSQRILSCLIFFIGLFSTILGIGGGTMTVPLFLRWNLSLKGAIAASTVTGFIVSLLGASSYLLLGLKETSTLPLTIGYVYLPAFFILAITTFVAAPYGVELAHRIHSKHLNQIFAFGLLIVGVLLLLRF
jgi:uncharacterized membrane protein YfcA